VTNTADHSLRATTGIRVKTEADKKGNVWLFLVNGAQPTFEEERVAREELKKISNCFSSKKIVKPEHIVCASAGNNRLFQHKTKMRIQSLNSVIDPSIPQSEDIFMQEDQLQYVSFAL